MNVIEKGKEVFTQENMMKVLDTCYKKAVDGLDKVSPPISVFAQNYLEKEPNPRKAAKKMINNQVIKCTTSGFVTGFGGFLTMPVTIPANISSVLYVQIRMIACTAYMAGLDVDSDQVQTLVYACLAGVGVNQFAKKFGVKVGEKLAVNMIKKIPGKTLVKINQRVGFRLVTKFGQKGLVNLGKLVPGVGAVIGGGLDLAETRIIGNRAYKFFFEGNFEGDKESENEEDFIDVDFTFEDVDEVETVIEEDSQLNDEVNTTEETEEKI